MLDKTIKFLDRAVDLGVLIVSLLLFLTGLYALIDSYLLYQNANNTDILKYKPGYESNNDSDKKIEDNMVAWLTVEGTGIDYPVMQGKDNSEYLNKDPFGEYSLTGSIFLDSRNSKDFSDSYSLIYGHHVDHGAMFGSLDNFMEEEFFEAHPYGSLTVGDIVYKIQFFAVLEADANEDAIFAPTEAEGTISFVREHAVHVKNDLLEKTGNTRYIALSTCKYPDTVERTVVFGLLTKM